MMYEAITNIFCLIAIVSILGSIGYPLLFEIFHSITRIHRYSGKDTKDRIQK